MNKKRLKALEYFLGVIYDKDGDEYYFDADNEYSVLSELHRKRILFNHTQIDTTQTDDNVKII